MLKVLESLPWVRKAEIDFEKKQATVIVETKLFKPEELTRVLVDAGFGGTVAKDIAKVEKAKTPPGLRVTFRVSGMKKAKSGAT